MGDKILSFEIDEVIQYHLIEDLDDISMTLRPEAEIVAYERTHHYFKPKTIPAKAVQ